MMLLCRSVSNDFYLEEDFEDTVETDLNEVFKDIDGDLTFEFVVSDENILGVSIGEPNA